MVRIGLVGDYNAKVAAHRAIPIALQLAAKSVGVKVDYEWVGTDGITDAARLSGFTGLWCVPGSPYRNMEGALTAIRFARERGRPFLGTCGGFQHAVIEYARNVLQWGDADHAETSPDSARAVIALLQCPLVEVERRIRFVAGSRIAQAYGAAEATEGYHCSYGVNPDFQAALIAGPLRVTAHDDAGDVRAIELDGHPFFVASLFQPERAALRDSLPPLVAAFVGACAST